MLPQRKEQYMCSDPYDFTGGDESMINGECPDCGAPTVDGQAAYGCNWSPCDCKTCDSHACDLSC
jgi:hypothetical protein